MGKGLEVGYRYDDEARAAIAEAVRADTAFRLQGDPDFNDLVDLAQGEDAEAMDLRDSIDTLLAQRATLLDQDHDDNDSANIDANLRRINDALAEAKKKHLTHDLAGRLYDDEAAKAQSE